MPSFPPLRMRWPSGIAATAITVLVCPAQVLTRLLLATLHTLTRLSCAPLMMCWPSGVTATAHAGVPLEGVDERPVDVVQPDVALVLAHVKADHKVHAVGQRRDAVHVPPPTSKVRSRAPSSVHSFAVPSSETLTKRAPPGSTATAIVCAWMVRSHAPSRHTLTVLSSEPVMTRPSGAAATHHTGSACSKHTRRCACSAAGAASRNARQVRFTPLMLRTRQSCASMRLRTRRVGGDRGELCRCLDGHEGVEKAQRLGVALLLENVGELRASNTHAVESANERARHRAST